MSDHETLALHVTVVIRDESPVRYVNEPPTYRTVHLRLTDEQLRCLTFKNDNEVFGSTWLENR